MSATPDQPDRTLDLDSRTMADMSSGDARAAQERAGDRIGPYTLVSPLGEGGFAIVWLAERREPFAQQVALKLIKPGMDSRSVIARFEQERQALALMDHPHVARVLDGGLTPQGRPYFAMEFVRGETITAFCDRRRCTVPERLAVFEQVCDAVQHAHTKGIIHRDLKPSNVLVTLGAGDVPQVKVIDFGIAKAVLQRLSEKTIFTETGQMIGTPVYMSPEQADPGHLDVDTRSDVYSLGVILYELLAGVTPFDLQELRSHAYREVQRIIQEEDPPTPSARLSTMASRDAGLATRIAQARRHATPNLARLLRTELEWIPLKAMRKERSRRYASAESLAADVRRYLEGKPLEAAPESGAYRLRKFVRRHRLQVGAVAAVLLALATGLVAAGLALDRALRAESGLRAQLDETAKARQAERERADQLDQVSEFQSRMLSRIDATTAGSELMQDLRQRFDAALRKADLPEAERAARKASFEADLSRLNGTDTAASMIDRTVLRPAMAAVSERFQDQPVVDAQMRQSLADVYRTLGLDDAARPLQARALEIRRRLLGNEDVRTVASMASMAALLKDDGAIADAERLYQEALETSRRAFGEDSPSTLAAINNMGVLRQAQGRLSEAEALFREALERNRRVQGDGHPDTIASCNDLGVLLQMRGDSAGAEPLCREALDGLRRLHGDANPDTLKSMINLGFVLQSQGKLPDAETQFRMALERCRAALGEEHPLTSVAINNLGFLLQAEGKPAAAEPLFREALDKRLRLQGADHPDTLLSMSNLGAVLWQQGKLNEAEPFYREAVATHRRVLGATHPDTLLTTHTLGMVLLTNQKHLEGVELLAPLEEAFRSAFTGGTARRLGRFLAVLGRCRAGLGFEAGQFPLADVNLTEAHPLLVAGYGTSHNDTTSCAQALINLHLAWDKAEPGRGHADKAREWNAVRERDAAASTAKPVTSP